MPVGRCAKHRGEMAMGSSMSRFAADRMRHARKTVIAQLLVSTAIVGSLGIPDAIAQTSSSSTPQPAAAGNQLRTFNIPAQSLASALQAFGRQSGLQVTLASTTSQGVTSSAINGRYTPEQALVQLLAGTNISFRITPDRTAIVGSADNAGAATVDGAIALDTIDVSGGSGGDGGTVYTPYETAAPTAHISAETIERFRGSGPADIFRGTPGVMSGEARNGGGAIDINIRGMQGMGRVATKIDGAENALTVYQGYQGLSNRTFVDPDLLAGVDITKGSDAASRGIAGTVEMRTLSADDVVKPGETWGGWIKSGFSTNTATPRPGDLGGYTWPRPYVSDPQPYPVPTASASGLDRPGLLDPTGGSFSAVAAVKEEKYDLLAGYAFRKQGNYFAGKNGPGAKVIDTGPQPLCYPSGFCYYPPDPISYAHVYENGGLSSYRAGEQVLNTQLETESWLAKATIRPDDDQSLQLGYTGYRSSAGDVVSSLFSSPFSQALQQAYSNNVEVDTGTLRYRWNPHDNDLVDLRTNLWLTKLTMRTTPRASYFSARPEDFGLAFHYLPGNESKMWGGDVSNKSSFAFDQLGSLQFTYGVSYINESTNPLAFSDQLNIGIPSRNGSREEVGVFGKAAYKPVDWLTLNAGLRYSHYWSEDRGTITNATQVNTELTRDDGGYSPSAGVVLEPIKGAQLYANYSSALRMPSLFESVAGYTLVPNADLRPERSNNWEIGVNVIRDGVFAPQDRGMLKFGYFNWDVQDYVARMSRQFVDPTYGYSYSALQVVNIDRAKFEGLEFSGRHENNGFTADLSANYYLNVEFCPTADTCSGSTISGDYATNQVPPQYSANLTVSQKLLDDKLTVGGRASYIGPRSVGHGPVQYGASAIIAPIIWRPYWLFDVFAEHKLSEDTTLWATVENVTDQYYVDPLSLVQQPGPGRTVRVGMTTKLGGSDPVSFASLGRLFESTDGVTDWSGPYAGVSLTYNLAEFGGTTTALDGTSTGYPALESPNLNVEALSFGIQAGYNFRLGNNIVVGIEGDIVKSQIAGTQITYATEGSTAADSNNLNRSRQFEAVQKSEVEWLSTLRGRLGYAFNDRLLLYVTGGLAFMHQNEERTQYVGARAWAGQTAPVTTTVQAFTESASATRIGYAIGGGAEIALNNSWSLTGEYLLARFGEATFNFPEAKAGVMLSNNNGYPVTSEVTNGRKVHSKVDIPMLRVGVNYRF